MAFARLFATALALSSLAAPGSCWGSLGHRTVAFVAQQSLTDAGTAFLNDLLRGADISEAALWADKIKHTPAGHGTEGWHFIDAKDDPPRVCNVKYSRDCVPKTGCVVSAIMNMTSRVNSPSLPFTARQQALKFLLHFIGDVHQPLHTEDEARGGNGIEVRFGRKNTNLHAVWDTDIPVKHAGGRGGSADEREEASAWADKLVASGAPAGEDWLRCVDVGEPEKCAVAWAGEANAYICSYVLKDDVDGVSGVDLSGEYFDGAVPIVDELIAKAGFRLGAWIEGLAAERAQMVADGAVFEGPPVGDQQETFVWEEL